MSNAVKVAGKILLAEDSLDDIELTKHVLWKEHLLDHVHIVRDGVEALEYLFCTGAYADRCSFDLPKVIFLDLKLPKVSGLEVLAQIKADPRTRLIPVVMLTSSGEASDIAQSYRLGASSYIVKPVDFDHFADIVHHLSRYWLLLNLTPGQEGHWLRENHR